MNQPLERGRCRRPKQFAGLRRKNPGLRLHPDPPVRIPCGEPLPCRLLFICAAVSRPGGNIRPGRCGCRGGSGDDRGFCGQRYGSAVRWIGQVRNSRSGGRFLRLRRWSRTCGKFGCDGVFRLCRIPRLPGLHRLFRMSSLCRLLRLYSLRRLFRRHGLRRLFRWRGLYWLFGRRGLHRLFRRFGQLRAFRL